MRHPYCEFWGSLEREAANQLFPSLRCSDAQALPNHVKVVLVNVGAEARG